MHKVLRTGICKFFLQKNNIKYEITIYQAYLLQEICVNINQKNLLFGLFNR